MSAGAVPVNEREAYIALNMMERVGPVGVRALRAALGSAAAIFTADRAALLATEGIGAETAAAILAQRETVDWRGELERAEAAGARIVTAIDEEYPAALREIHDPPLALYVRGTLCSGDKHALAVVGTRHPTHYGRETAERFAAELARAGVTVVSGLAEGIDTAAHRGALRGAGRTLAVIGSGLDSVYPASNRGLAEEIAKQGAVLSEFPFGRAPDRTTFPIRNRIVSGLSTGVIVVEAGARSGALITARQAAEQGRQVFAVPGRIDSPASQGCHELIRGGATLASCVADVFAEYEFLFRAPGERSSAPAGPAPRLSGDEAAVLALLEQGECDVDQLIRASRLPVATVNSVLICLEMKKLVRMLPGRIVERVRPAG